MRKVTVLMMRERYAQTVFTFRITYVLGDGILVKCDKKRQHIKKNSTCRY